MSDDEQPMFESADAGSSLTYPSAVGSLRKSGHCMIKEKPCKIVDISTCKTGKHGSAKANYTGIDIFTGRKYEDCHPTSHNVDIPRVVRVEYQLLNIDGSRVCLLTDAGETKEDLDLPTDNDGTEDDVAANIRALFDDGKNVIVSVISAVGQEKIIAAKETANP
jgi:translation initiation factor 5A